MAATANDGRTAAAPARDDEADDLRKHEQADCGDVPGTGAMTDPTKNAGRQGQHVSTAPKVDNAPASTPTGSPTAPGDPRDSGAPAG